ncbi:MAG: hypothetical protein L0H31_02705 [Nocardioidaceae bacterium]|nr:hypothetical protein [Nocardioidaceae bacterium]
MAHPDESGHHESDWERERRRAEIFGDPLPSVTTDEVDESASEKERESAAERWLKAQVPPHHG